MIIFVQLPYSHFLSLICVICGPYSGTIRFNSSRILSPVPSIINQSFNMLPQHLQSKPLPRPSRSALCALRLKGTSKKTISVSGSNPDKRIMFSVLRHPTPNPKLLYFSRRDAEAQSVKTSFSLPHLCVSARDIFFRFFFIREIREIRAKKDLWLILNLRPQLPRLLLPRKP